MVQFRVQASPVFAEQVRTGLNPSKIPSLEINTSEWFKPLRHIKIQELMCLKAFKPLTHPNKSESMAHLRQSD